MMKRRGFFAALATAAAGTAASSRPIRSAEPPLNAVSPICPRCGSYLPYPSIGPRRANSDTVETRCWVADCGWSGAARFYEEQA